MEASTAPTPTFTLEALRRKRGRYEEVNGVLCKWCSDCHAFQPLDAFDYVPSLGRHTAYCRTHETARAAYAQTPEGKAEAAYWTEVARRRRERAQDPSYAPTPRKHSRHEVVDGVLHKTCTACNRLLPLDQFAKHGKHLRSQCKECKAPKDRAYMERNAERVQQRRHGYYQRNKAQCLAQAKRWRKANQERYLATSRLSRRQYRANHHEETLAKQRAYNQRPEVKAKRRVWDRLNSRPHWSREATKAWHKRRLENDIQYRLKVRCKARLSSYLSAHGARKHYHSIELIGCTIAQLKTHLESHWQPGMSWENYGRYRRGGLMTWHIDHIKPVASFDLTDPKQQRACFHWTNLQPLWAPENMAKHDKLDWTPTHA